MSDEDLKIREFDEFEVIEGPKECDCKKEEDGAVQHDSKTCHLVKPDWTGKCENCEGTPIVPITGLCGPCTFGEAETIGGNW